MCRSTTGRRFRSARAATLKDADGRFYTTTTLGADRIGTKPEVVAHQVAKGGAATQYPFISVCRDTSGARLGYFATTITYTGTSGTDMVYTLTSPGDAPPGVRRRPPHDHHPHRCRRGKGPEAHRDDLPGRRRNGDVQGGHHDPRHRPGRSRSATFTFAVVADGGHTYTADFAPTDPAAFKASQSSKTVTVALDAGTGQLTLDVPAAPVVDGSLIFAVPFDTPVALKGARVASNTRVTAAGAFPTVTVTDTRRDELLSSWEVNAQASDFTGSGSTVGAKYLGWDPAAPTMTKEAGSPLVAQAGAAVMSFLDNASSAGLGAGSLLGKAAPPVAASRRSTPRSTWPSRPRPARGPTPPR